MQRPRIKSIPVNPKYLKVAFIVLAVLLVILLIGGYIAYTKRKAILDREITKAKAKAKARPKPAVRRKLLVEQRLRVGGLLGSICVKS